MRRSLRSLRPLLKRSPIPLRKCPREPLTWKSGRGFIPTMTNPSPLPGSGSTLTTRTTPFGEEITSTTTSSPWCSCPVISSVECSSVWTNSIRMLFCLFGEDNNSSISGIWVFKGHELAFELDDNWQIDHSSYTWRKLESKSDETKKLVDQYWKWEGTDEKGRKFN